MPPLTDDVTCLRHGYKLFTAEAFVPEATVEALNEAILPWTAWLNKRGLDIDRFQEGSNATGDKLWTVVTSDELWNSSFRKLLGQLFDEVVTGELATYFQSNTLTCVFVDHDQYLQ